MRRRFPSGRYLLDTSCLVKLLVFEEGHASWPVNELLRQGSRTLRVLTGRSSVVEAFGVLKAKRKARRPDHITQEQYAFAALSLARLTRVHGLMVVDPRIGWGRFQRIVSEANAARVDVLDALQLEIMRRLLKARVAPPAVLVTTDRGLVEAAKSQAIPVWNPERSELPPEC